MERLLNSFETPFVDTDGSEYDVELYGRSRPDDTWEGWLVFVARDGSRFSTPTETTQSSSDLIVYWAGGLTETYFVGAFQRARRPAKNPDIIADAPAPLRDASVDHATYVQRLTELEEKILNSFQRADTTRLPTQEVLDVLPNAHADVVRALEDLEKRRRVLVRRTEEGNDWLILTQDGIQQNGS